MTSPRRRLLPKSRGQAIACSLLVHGAIVGTALLGGRVDATADWSDPATGPRVPLQLAALRPVRPPQAQPELLVATEEPIDEPWLIEALPEAADRSPIEPPMAAPAELPEPIPPLPPSSWLTPLRPPEELETEPATTETPAEPAGPPPNEPVAAPMSARPSPRPGQNRPPPYPVAAVKLGIEGTVVVILEVDATGRVSAAHIEQSSGSALLDDTALHALSRWRFEPARYGGIAVPSTFRKEVQFRRSGPAG